MREQSSTRIRSLLGPHAGTPSPSLRSSREDPPEGQSLRILWEPLSCGLQFFFSFLQVFTPAEFLHS